MHLRGKQAQAGSSVEMSPRYKAQQAAGQARSAGSGKARKSLLQQAPSGC